MKQLMFLLVAILIFSACGAEKPADKADNLEWVLNLKDAQAKAAKEDKVTFALFTGSDWCIWCQKLEGEVFTDPAFKSYADQALVLAKFDFMRKSNLSQEQQEYNKKTAKEFEIRGYPTVVLFDENGKEIGRTGYQKGGGIKYIEHLEELISKKK